MTVKKILYCVLFFILFFPVQTSANAQENSPSITISPTPIDYTLPYPGILPDNPIYFLKAIRDKMQEFFQSRPLEKADFDLLQTDKRVQASYLLVTSENKTDLAESTFSKALNYFEDAIAKVTEAKKEGNDISDLVKRLTVANLKHKEILQTIEQKIEKSDMKKFEKDKERVETLGKKVKQIKTK